MKKQFKYTLLIISLLISCYSGNAQWSFTATYRASGPCSIIESPFTESHTGFSTKSECEAKRQSLLNWNSTEGNNCTHYYTCTECIGSDIGGSNRSNSPVGNGNINFNGVSQGSAFFSNNPAQAVNNWIDNWRLQYQKLYDWQHSQFYKDHYDNWQLNLPKTGNANFDNALSSLVETTSLRNGQNTNNVNSTGSYSDNSSTKINNAQGQDDMNTSNSGKSSWADEINAQIQDNTNSSNNTNAPTITADVTDASQLRVTTQQDEPPMPNVDESSLKHLAVPDVPVASDNSGNFDWKGLADFGINAAQFGAGLALDATSVVGVLALANVNLYAELGRYIMHPEQYEWGLKGTGQILTNAFVNTLGSVAIGNSAKIAGTWYSGAKAANGLPANLSYTEGRILLSGQKVLDAGTTGYDAGGLINQVYGLASGDK